MLDHRPNVAPPSRSVPLLLALLACAALLTSSAAAQPGQRSLEGVLRLVTKLNLQAGNDKDLGLYAATLHPAAPGFEATLEEMGSLFKLYDFRFTLLSFTLVAVDDDYAYARIGQGTRRLAGADFPDNVSESLWVYALAGEEWKVWSNALLTVELLSPPPTDPAGVDAQTRLHYPLYGVLLDVLDAAAVDCGSEPDLPPVARGALRRCFTLPEGAPPLPDEHLFAFLIHMVGLEPGVWLETEFGQRLTVTAGAVTYVYTYRPGRPVFVDMTR